MSCLKEGFRIAGRHKRLVLILWLGPLVPAVILATMAAANLMPALGQSLFADRALNGDWFVVLREFRDSPADALASILGPGLVAMAMLTWLMQIVLSAGVVEVLLERNPVHPFVRGARRNFLPFLRTTISLALPTAALLVGARFLIKGFSKLAESHSDGRLDLLGVGLAVVLFFVLWAPLDLAADLSRIGAVRHGHRSMLRGFFRALAEVLRRPGLLLPIYLAFVLLPLLLHFVYYQLRSPWTPATLAAILALVLAQQSVMLFRAFLRLAFWGAEIAVYRELGEKEFCRPKAKTQLDEDQDPVTDSSLIAQGVDGIQSSSAESRVEARDDADSQGDSGGQENRP